MVAIPRFANGVHKIMERKSSDEDPGVVFSIDGKTYTFPSSKLNPDLLSPANREKLESILAPMTKERRVAFTAVLEYERAARENLRAERLLTKTILPEASKK